ncbi:hypothetical protein Drose_06775 [Dactylosporangium roseum]|uniref:Uncharacterized protein n=1 Tax=Dactylosporangium roseum TaxID=47989 RepID=A0ABY5Z7C9_9ACTN|nr:hypothetical protein [Dactylosporangium roseum]UWZ37971.1 hypothetical protein Drose_06775 [Dactylosporangium roseum]
MEPDPFAPPNPPEFSADRLLARKEQVITAFHKHSADLPKTVRSHRRRHLTLAAAGLVIAAAIGVPSLIGSRSNPAYALTPNADGTVTFVINDVSDPEGATRALRRAGIRAIVLPAHQPGTCPADQRGTHLRPYTTGVAQMFRDDKEHPELGANSIIIRPDHIGTGEVLVISVIRVGPAGDERTHVIRDVFREPGPTCYEPGQPWLGLYGVPTLSPPSSTTSTSRSASDPSSAPGPTDNRTSSSPDPQRSTATANPSRSR